MVDIEKLNSAIEELESSSKDILKLSDAIKEIRLLIDKTQENSEVVNGSIQDFNEAKAKIFLSSELCEKAYKLIEEYCMKSEAINASFISRVNTLLLELKNENTSIYRNFESAIMTKIDLFKSDLIVENRKITSDVIDSLSEKVNAMDENTKSYVIKSTEKVSDEINKSIKSKSKIQVALTCGSLLISAATLILLLIIR